MVAETLLMQGKKPRTYTIPQLKTGNFTAA
jgi:hypothetical protein